MLLGPTAYLCTYRGVSFYIAHAETGRHSRMIPHSTFEEWLWNVAYPFGVQHDLYNEDSVFMNHSGRKSAEMLFEEGVSGEA